MTSYFKITILYVFIFLLGTINSLLARNTPLPPHTPPLEAESFVSDIPVKTAGVYWLPDFGSNYNSNSNNGNNGGDRKSACNDYGYLPSCPANKTGTLIKPAPALSCYKDCKCSNNFKYTSAQCLGNPSGTSCDSLYSTCDCPDGYSNSLKTLSDCNNTSGYTFNSQTAGDKICGRCDIKSCPAGSSTTTTCDNLNTKCILAGYSGTQTCYKSENIPCPENKTNCQYGCKTWDTSRQQTCGKICAECNACSNTCNNGYTQTTCTASQTLTDSYANSCGNTCYKCSDCEETCPTGYHENTCKSQNNRPQQTQNGCKTKTCYKCTTPNSGGYYGGDNYGQCGPSCPEGYTYNEATQDYDCKPLTCRNLIKNKYPDLVDGSIWVYDYKLGKNMLARAAYSGGSSETPPIVNSNILSEVDYDDEFPACANYCRPGYAINNTTFEGNIKIGYDSPNWSSGGESTNITINGNVKFPIGKNFNVQGLTITQGSSFRGCGQWSNIILYPSTKLDIEVWKKGYGTGSNLNGVTIMPNTSATPITINSNGTTNINQMIAPNPQGVFINFDGTTDKNTGSFIFKSNLIRNPGGKITFKLRGTSSFDNYEFAADTTITLLKGGCFKLNGHKICSKIDSTVLTFKDADNYTIPSCCSSDSGCPANIWNGNIICNGSVTYE